MKLSKDFEDALRRPNTERFVYELTAERKLLLQGVCGEIIDLLQKRTEGPAEAFIAIRFVWETLEDLTGCKMEGQSFSKEDMGSKH